jgi:hypothetical protein
MAGSMGRADAASDDATMVSFGWMLQTTVRSQ